jgi:hypothetical protein
MEKGLEFHEELERSGARGKDEVLR